jgi:hypothetical protein
MVMLINFGGKGAELTLQSVYINFARSNWGAAFPT